MILLLGSTGNLGNSIQNYFKIEEIITLGRNEISAWTGENAVSNIDFSLKKFPEVTHIILALGDTDSKKTLSELMKVNCELPLNILNASKRRNIRVITFGSFNERFFKHPDDNPYIKSKKEFCVRKDLPTNYHPNHLHFHIHTWYGGKLLHPHMFLGQIYTAIERQLKFQMTEGNQLREYHHINDDMQIIAALIKSDIQGVYEINSGEPIKLKDLASNIFDYYNSSRLLQVGFLQTPPYETNNFDILSPNDKYDTRFRETIPGVIEYLSSIGLTKV